MIDEENYSDKVFRYNISLDKIEYYGVEGKVFRENKISGGGGGGSSVVGAIVGGAIAGETGAIIGSRRKVNEIKSELLTHDNRAMVLNF